jgi:hypothetical protein
LPTDPLFEFHLPLESCPAKPSRPAAAGRLLSWTSRSLQHTGGRRSTDAGFACPLRCARRVWLPSRRLTPADSVPVLFHTGGARGIHPSEPSLTQGRRGVSTPTGPTYRFDLRVLSPPKRRAGLAGPRFLGFDPCESPCTTDACLARLPPVAPMGFALSGFARTSLAGISPGLLPRAWSPVCKQPGRNLRLGVSIGSYLARSAAPRTGRDR